MIVKKVNTFATMNKSVNHSRRLSCNAHDGELMKDEDPLK